MDSDQKIVAALGRPFTLGMLYDAHKDELQTGFTLWDRKTLQEHISEQRLHSSSFEVTTSDSFESKSSLLDINASLKASFLGGLVDVEGSAKYLNDQKKSKNHSRVTLQFKAVTTFRQFSMSEHEDKNKLNVPGPVRESATHVVTGILYGANAFFVFDSEKLDTSSVQDIQGSMQALIKKIPLVDIEGKVGIKLTDEEKALVAKFSCTFIGDFILPSNPSTFEEAVQTYIGLPKLLGDDIGVPLKVWLTPLKKFSPTAAELKGTICPDLVKKVEKALEDIRQAEMRCNELLDDDVVENVPQIRDKLRKFQNYCEGYKLKLQQLMQKNVPLIRKGQEDHSSVENFFEMKDSPFSYDNLDKWLTNREREVNVIRSCVDMVMDGTNVKMVARQSDLDREVMAKGAYRALCFDFTSVKRDDPYLDQMAQFLDTPGPSNEENVPQTKEDPWYYSDKVVLKMREKAAAFHGFASDSKNKTRFCFLVATLPNEKYQGSTIYHYNNSVLVNDDFPLNFPDVMKATRNDLMQYATNLTMDPNTVNTQLILSDGNKRVIVASEPQTYPDHPDRFDSLPQVLCREGLKGRYYWEVEWSSGDSSHVGVAVAYNRIERKGNSSATQFGENEVSWYFEMHKGCLQAYHKVAVWNGPLPSSGCKILGVYLDWPAGTLSFYDATSNTLSHIYTFYTEFSEPVYPGFCLRYTNNYIYLRLKEADPICTQTESA